MASRSHREEVVAGRSPTGQNRAWQILEHVPDGVILADLRGSIVFANSHAATLFGYGKHDLVGRPIHDLVPDRFQHRHQEHFAAFAAAPSPRPIGSGLELHARHRDGYDMLVDISLRPFETDEGMLIAASVRDISERRRLMDAVRESAHFNLALLASLRDHIALLDRDGKILAVNDAWMRFAEDNDSEETDKLGPGVNYLDACRGAIQNGDESAARALKGVRAVIEGAEAQFRMEYPCDSPDEPRWFHMTVLPLVRDEGGAIVVHGNITRRKFAELGLNQALEENERLREKLSAENVYLREEIKSAHDFEEIVGNSQPLLEMLRQIEQVADTNSNVLILGGTGTGKELVARAIHERSPRKDRPLVKVNCAALPASLLESELFGHKKGTFTGAVADRIGRFELADGGTIFLDEIGELPLELQSKLLHVLQEGQFERLGSATTKTVDVRVIAATNRDLQQAMDEKKFRDDLYFRLAVFPVEVPPLHERSDDVPLLAWHFVEKHQARLGKKFEKIPAEAMDALAAYDWPGNVRELENVVERAMILSTGPSLNFSNFLGQLRTRQDAPHESTELKSVERTHIIKILEQCDWKVKGTGNAAEQLGMKPGTLRYQMKVLGIERPKK